jgi:hypothetical protein
MQNDCMRAGHAENDLYFVEHRQVADFNAQRLQCGFFSREGGRIAKGWVFAGSAALHFFVGKDSIALPPLAPREFLRDAAIFEKVNSDTDDHDDAPSSHAI